LLILLIKNFTGYPGVLHLYYSLYAVQVLSPVPLHVIDLFLLQCVHGLGFSELQDVPHCVQGLRFGFELEKKERE
jgi:hypothetical protein